MSIHERTTALYLCGISILMNIKKPISNKYVIAGLAYLQCKDIYSFKIPKEKKISFFKIPFKATIQDIFNFFVFILLSITCVVSIHTPN